MNLLCNVKIATFIDCPRDDDNCLQTSPQWSEYSTCSSRTWYCESWGKDMRRCCPVSCTSGVFTEEDCLAYAGDGTCIYPNDAQCQGKGTL